MAVAHYQLGKGYIADLEKRMKRYEISQNALAKAMFPPTAATQVNRWFTKNPARQVTPTLETAERIEKAIEKLRLKWARGLR